jgi:membrane protease subunit HflK
MRRVLWLVLLAGLVVYGLTGVVQVRPGERAVVRRFGRVLPYKPDPGLWVGLPWGMDRVDRVVVDQVRSVTVGYEDESAGDLALPPGQLLTGDHNLVNVQAIVYYTVRPDEVADFVVQGSRIDGLLTRLVEASMAEWVAARTVDAVLLEGKNALRADLLARLPGRLSDYRLGIEVQDVRVALIAPPSDVKDAFDNVARAQAEKATLLNKARQDARVRLEAGRADVFRIEQGAESFAYAERTRGQVDADRFLARMRKYRLAKDAPGYLRQLWRQEQARLFRKVQESGGRLGPLDHRLGGKGIDLHAAPLRPEGR